MEAYKNSRKTKVENLGKDIEGSARHIRGGARSIDEVLNSDDILNMAKKSFLLKNFPPQYEKRDEISAKIHLIVRKYPSKLSDAYYCEDKESEARLYVEFYQELVQKAVEWESLVRNGVCGLQEVVEGLKINAKNKIKEARENNRKSLFANTMVDFHNNALYERPYGRAAIKEIGELNKAIKENLVDETVISKILDKNQGIKAALGTAKKAKSYFNRKEAYGKSVERVGKELKVDHADYLMNEVGLVGVQWGNYVSDKERTSHLKMISEAFNDLSEAIDLPLDKITRGKLSVAVGARGRGSALAHYESDTDCINLTKKSGFGSLAHEIGHFLDKEFTSQFTTSGDFITSTAVRLYAGTEHEEILMKWHELKMKIRRRISSERLLVKVSPGKRDYWRSGHEIFARCFEVYVKSEMTKKNIKNNYLVCEISHGLWCNKEELQDFKEIIEYILEQLRSVVGE